MELNGKTQGYAERALLHRYEWVGWLEAASSRATIPIFPVEAPGHGQEVPNLKF